MFSLSNIALLGASQGLMLLLALLTINFGNQRANRVLAAFIGVLSLRLFVIAFEYLPEGQYLPHQQLFSLLHLSYCIGPLLYFYVRLLVQPNYQFHWQQWLHFAPVLIAALALSPGGPIIDIDTADYDRYSALPELIQSRVALATMPLFATLVIYSLLSLATLRPYQAAIKNQFSSLESINLNWLKVLVWICLVTALISLLALLLRAIGFNVIGPRAFYSVLLSVCLIYYIGLMGLRQPRVFDQDQRQPATVSPTDNNQSRPDTVTKETEKYAKSGLDQQRIDTLWRNLDTLMIEQQPFLTAGIKLAELAEQLATRPNYLSQVINSKADESFFDYINRHRIEAACEMLLTQPNSSIGDIALSTGFNSQNVFNNHFKKRTGQTPSHYRKTHKAA
ncbi:HTH-type transcriptional activator RhaR [Sinobacterium norvegicum]|uniref:HTH-type transcriptional activator RhaR n=1 Tax=Sinobacterium norvegicum TaxID=1641715 RepID=A0ABN8EBY8_9GAMM|nr:helix-turn-helix domain-containing protein [Sinobacterium norvegicum]CAH0990014.1 HTH-type transcriptional activator RhaR [Sinobacterium norvegicum]